MGLDKLKIINDVTDDDVTTKQVDKKQPLERPSSKLLTPTLSKLSFSAFPLTNVKSVYHHQQPVIKPPESENNKAVLMRKDSERI